MQEIKKLDDLGELIGKEAVDRCFAEYFANMAAKAKKYDDLLNRRATMDDEEMRKYIKLIDRNELDEDIREKKCESVERYLQAIRVSLIVQGYDQEWVETTFREALEERYLWSLTW